MMSARRFVAPSVALALGALTGCGANASTGELDLSPRGEAGLQVARSNGCASCHGTSGQGGVGPPFVGLYESTVELDGADPVVADTAYLVESITDPGAKRVAGYRLQMPTSDLSPDEIEAVVAYIVDLAAAGDPEEGDGT